ncbi:hypothetical protein GB937_007102 [Aspergillus fischeri]|nr:hypothetical protein GB937_007102 [Aspergillus fischeri]
MGRQRFTLEHFLATQRRAAENPTTSFDSVLHNALIASIANGWQCSGWSNCEERLLQIPIVPQCLLRLVNCSFGWGVSSSSGAGVRCLGSEGADMHEVNRGEVKNAPSRC